MKTIIAGLVLAFGLLASAQTTVEPPSERGEVVIRAINNGPCTILFQLVKDSTLLSVVPVKQGYRHWLHVIPYDHVAEVTVIADMRLCQATKPTTSLRAR